MGLLNRAVAAVWNVMHPRAGDDFWYTPYGNGRNAAGVIITPDLALKASAVYACVKILAEIIGSLPCEVFRQRSDGGLEPARSHPLNEIVRWQPNDTQTAIDFWTMMMFHAALRGTAYAEIKPGARGAVDQLIPLHTDRVTPECLPDGSLRFKVSNPHTGEMRTLLQEEVFRIPGLSSDGIKGLRAVDIAAEAIGLGMAADSYAARVFSNKLNIGGFLVHPGKLSEEAQKNLIQRLMERFAGIDNAHRPIVLQEGLKFEKASMDAEQAQLLDARKWQKREVGTFWNIPPFMLGLDDAQGNAEQQAYDLVKYTLRPWVERIEQAVRRDLIVAKGVYLVHFDLDAVLRGIAKDRADYLSKALGSGGSPAWMTQNEARIYEGLNPVDDPRADTLGVGTNPDTSTPASNMAADQATKARADRVVRKEIAAVRKAALRLAADPDGFRSWIKAFYGGHVSFVMETLGIAKGAAKVYCDFQRDTLLKANDTESTLDRWEANLAVEIAATLTKHGDGHEQ